MVAEGHAREFVSCLQQARKDAGLEVSDRIRVSWSCADAEVDAAIGQHSVHVASEVLATTFVRGEGAQEADVNGRTVRFSLAKA